MAVYRIIHTEELVGEYEIEADSEDEALEEYLYQVSEGRIDFNDLEMVDSSDKVLRKEA